MSIDWKYVVSTITKNAAFPTEHRKEYDNVINSAGRMEYVFTRHIGNVIMERRFSSDFERIVDGNFLCLQIGDAYVIFELKHIPLHAIDSIPNDDLLSITIGISQTKNHIFVNGPIIRGEVTEETETMIMETLLLL